MRGTTVQRVFGGIKADLYLPPKSLTAAPCRLVLVGDGRSLFDILPQVLSPLEEKMAAAGQGLVLVGLDSGEQRDADYTPWPARGFDADYPDFPGKADDYLRRLDEVLLPALRAELPVSADPADTGILGFSLSGLLATYAPFRSANFGWSMSISGSNWYDGFIPFLAGHDPVGDCRFFLSYGRAEGAGKYSMHRDAGQSAEEAAAALRARLGAEGVTVISDNGRHSNKRVSRFTTALGWFWNGGRLPEQDGLYPKL